MVCHGSRVNNRRHSQTPYGLQSSEATRVPSNCIGSNKMVASRPLTQSDLLTDLGVKNRKRRYNQFDVFYDNSIRMHPGP